MDEAIAISDRKTSTIGVKDKDIRAFELLMMKRVAMTLRLMFFITKCKS